MPDLHLRRSLAARGLWPPPEPDIGAWHEWPRVAEREMWCARRRYQDRFVVELPLERFTSKFDASDPFVQEYARCMLRGDVFPPVRLSTRNDGSLALADGNHRVAAAKLIGRQTILATFCKVTPRRE